jgi:hypothetical protein
VPAWGKAPEMTRRQAKTNHRLIEPLDLYLLKS